jgi:hypothetical protein
MITFNNIDMVKLNLLFIPLFACCIACGNRTETNEEAGPGPISEPDKQRYNLNPSDEMLYDSLDSLVADSLAQDSLKRKE